MGTGMSNNEQGAEHMVSGRMYCRFCGADIADDSEFCPKCGKSTVYGGEENTEIHRL